MELVGSCIAALIGLGLFAFWIWMLVDCAKNEPSSNDRVVWTIVIAVTGFVGAAIYYFVQRPDRVGSAGAAARRRRVRA